MRDDELMKAGRSSSIGCGSGSSKQDWVGGVAQEQLQLPGGCSQGKKMVLAALPPAIGLAALQGGCRTKIN